MDLGLKGANVVVVGASRGIGRSAARCFAAEGANVALIARNPKGLEKTAAQCRDVGTGHRTSGSLNAINCHCGKLRCDHCDL